MSASASLPEETFKSAVRGELQKVVKWLRKGGLVDALYPVATDDGRATAQPLLHAAAGNGQLEMVKMLLKRGASVNLQTSLGGTALMEAANYGELSIVIVLLQHSADPDLKSIDGDTALMYAADLGQQACVKALLRAKANTELLNKDGLAALQYSEGRGHMNFAKLIRQHTAPPQPAAAAPAAALDAGEPAVSSPTSLPLEIYESAGRSLAGRAAEGGQVGAQGRAGRRALPC